MPLYRSNLANGITYFLNGVRQKDQKMLDALENPQKSGMFDSTIQIEARFKRNGFDVTKTGPFCLRNSYFHFKSKINKI